MPLTKRLLQYLRGGAYEIRKHVRFLHVETKGKKQLTEKWDLYTKYREKTGKEHIRGEKIPEGFYHMTVHVWIRNYKGEYLISRRSANRTTFPLMWECVGGAVLMGESSVDGAIREVNC
ncbi:MAG: NUDIX domain-containing protein [Lachnospiraceae bacterium]|nr:NUDIX domain-containing protein [Lachnospiraceae bacterium]